MPLLRLFMIFALSMTGALSASVAHAQEKPGNCAIWAEMAADTIKRDKRTEGKARKDVVKSLKSYADAQDKLMQSQMDETYAQSKAFGWDKAKVDAMIEANEIALRDGFHSSTMDEDTLYTDHVIALNRCVQGAQSKSELGQSATDILATLERMLAWTQS